MSQSKEILWNFINAGLAGALVFLGACSDGSITSKGIGAAIVTGLIVAMTKFRDYWATQEKEYSETNNEIKSPSKEHTVLYNLFSFI